MPEELSPAAEAAGGGLGPWVCAYLPFFFSEAQVRHASLSARPIHRALGRRSSLSPRNEWGADAGVTLTSRRGRGPERWHTTLRLSPATKAGCGATHPGASCPSRNIPILPRRSPKLAHEFKRFHQPVLAFLQTRLYEAPPGSPALG